MNRKQKVVLWIGILTILFMSAYPPWVEKEIKMTPTYSYTITRPGHYGFIFNPPLQADLSAKPPSVQEYEYEGFVLEQPPDGNLSWRIDLCRLGVQWVTVLVVTVGLIVIFVKKKKYPQDGSDSKE